MRQTIDLYAINAIMGISYHYRGFFYFFRGNLNYHDAINGKLLQ